MLSFYRPVETRVGGWGGCGGGGAAARPPPPQLQIFAKVDLLPIDNYSEKKKVAKRKKIQTSSNSSETTGSITFVQFMKSWN